jgi:hypothetical protein
MTVDQHPGGGESDETGPPTFRGWLLAAGRSLVDLRFHRTATHALLPLVYVCGLLVAVAVPVVLTVTLWQLSVLAGVVFAVIGAVPLGIMMAAIVRLLLEFLVHTARLAGRVGHISDLAEGLHGALTDVTVPMTQLSRDLRAVQFWRVGRR